MSIIEDEDKKTARLRRFGQKYIPDGYDLDGDLMKNDPHVAVLDFKIEHITGKKVKENKINNLIFVVSLEGDAGIVLQPSAGIFKTS